MFVGEIGISRCEFLYDLQFWEVRRIVRGYERRNILNYQLLRLTAYSSFFSMRDNKEGLSPQEWMPMYFDKFGQPENPPVSDEEIEELQAMMRSMRKE